MSWTHRVIHFYGDLRVSFTTILFDRNKNILSAIEFLCFSSALLSSSHLRHLFLEHINIEYSLIFKVLGFCQFKFSWCSIILLSRFHGSLIKLAHSKHKHFYKTLTQSNCDLAHILFFLNKKLNSGLLSSAHHLLCKETNTLELQPIFL